MVGKYVINARSLVLQVSKKYLRIPNCWAISKASVPKISTMRTLGRIFMAVIAERRAGNDSRMITAIRTTMFAEARGIEKAGDVFIGE